MPELEFDNEMGRIQRALGECHDMVIRRSPVLEAAGEYFFCSTPVITQAVKVS